MERAKLILGQVDRHQVAEAPVHLLSPILVLCNLLASPAFAQEIHIAHCLKGCPTGTPTTNDLIIREVYVLSSNDTTKFADWVAYRVTADTIGTGSGRNFRADPFLDDDETLETYDYDGAAGPPLNADIGHFAPLVMFKGTPYADLTNFMSNVSPQLHSPETQLRRPQ